MKLQEAIDNIKNAGFGYIKVELEAQLNRGYKSCVPCNGTGRGQCVTCSGDGYVESAECVTCEGVGVSRCQECRGEGGTDYGLDKCKELVKQQVGSDLWSKLIFARYYHDGSVDSELTFTLSIDDVAIVPKFIEAFRDVGKQASTTGRVDVRGAGMHISVLPAACNGKYPTYVVLDEAKNRNFREQMTRLLPALFFLASASEQIRPLRFREPRVSDEDKYSAIYSHYRSCYEFRVFETCYKHPERFFDFVEVIGNSLKFYADPSLKAPVLGKEFYFPRVSKVGGIFRTTEQLEILMEQIKYLKPDKTIAELKKERGVVATLRELKQIEAMRTREIESDYKTYRELVKAKIDLPLTENERVTIQRLIADGYSEAQAESRIRRARVGLTKTKDSFFKSKTNPFIGVKKVRV